LCHDAGLGKLTAEVMPRAPVNAGPEGNIRGVPSSGPSCPDHCLGHRLGPWGPWGPLGRGRRVGGRRKDH
jgi:hypothetical protein